MTDFECTPQVDLEFMNAEHRKSYDDANEIKRLLEAARTDLGSIEKKIGWISCWWIPSITSRKRKR